MKNCLIFGGNGFLGYETLLAITSLRNINVVVANRGRSWQWGKLRSLEERTQAKGPFKGMPQIFKLDRKEPLTRAGELMKYIHSVDSIDFVIDFSAYNKYAIEQVIETEELRRKIGHYIYISTDSVYEVCDVSAGKPLRECDSIRPSCPKRRHKLDKKDSYGRKKLECEEVLQTQRLNKGFAFTFLRLADVVGFHDSTNRWLEYQLWLKLGHALNIPVYLPESVTDKKISLVYNKDVASLIQNLITNEDLLSTAADEAFNIAFSENFSVKTVLNEIESCLGIHDVSIRFSDKAPQMFPSVENGPVDTSKVKSLLGWQPSTFKQSCQGIVTDYEESMRMGETQEELWEAAEELLSDVHDSYDAVTLERMEELLRKWIL